ncbi:hypothetical protein [Piscinibacterium candidicorallinum]|uniref:Uncharacterized protein n=1 Tax=Piscinibacterium candidicorallinum TaxID=1793872 RepID=A0ABV7H7S9_9BURK
MSAMKRWRGRAAAATSLAATAALALTLLLVGGTVLFKPWLPEQLCIGAMISTGAQPAAAGSAGPADPGRGTMLHLEIGGANRAVDTLSLGAFWIEDLRRQTCLPLTQIMSTQPLLFAAMLGLYFGSFFLLLWIFMVVMPGVLALGLALGLAGILIGAVALVGVVALPAAPLLILLWWLLRKPAQAAPPPAP